MNKLPLLKIFRLSISPLFVFIILNIAFYYLEYLFYFLEPRLKQTNTIDIFFEIAHSIFVFLSFFLSVLSLVVPWYVLYRHLKRNFREYNDFLCKQNEQSVQINTNKIVAIIILIVLLIVFIFI